MQMTFPYAFCQMGWLFRNMIVTCYLCPNYCLCHCLHQSYVSSSQKSCIVPRWIFFTQVNPIEEKLARWTQCQLSGEPLQQPVVADQLGFLFNKDAIIQVAISSCASRTWWQACGMLSLSACCHGAHVTARHNFSRLTFAFHYNLQQSWQLYNTHT